MNRTENRTGAPYEVTIPADVDREDRLLAGLTARQLAVLAVAGLAAGFIVTLARRLLPLPLAVALAGPVAVAGLMLALARVNGLPGDRFALAMLSYHLASRRRVPAPEGVTPPPAWATANADLPTPLTLPAQDLSSNGILDLGPDGASLVCRASAVNFRLRTEQEQEALIATFARFLHGVSAPVQIVIRSERADLHAADPDSVLPRRAEQAASLLAGAGIAVTPLDHEAAADVLANAANPNSSPRPPGLAPPGQTITRGTT